MVLYDLTLCHACMWPNFDNFIQPLPIWWQRKGNFFFRVVQVVVGLVFGGQRIRQD